MQNHTTKHFKDDIRRTIAIYALTPAIIITLFSYLLSFYILTTTVITRNKSVNKGISQKLEDTLVTYGNQVEEIALMEDVIKSILSNEKDINIYRRLYEFTNKMEIKGTFFIFNQKLQPVIASSTILPEYAWEENALKWGITSRMEETPDQVVLEQHVSEITGKRILSIGKAICEENRIIGYVTFDLDEKDLRSLINEKYSTDVVVTDQFGNVILETNDLLINRFGKIDATFRDKTGRVGTDNDRHYISRTEIMNRNFFIYTISSIGYIRKVMLITGGMLGVLFGMLIILSSKSAKKIAGSKTKVIDNIIEAIENVQNGNLDKLLNINTNDEFEIIADSYNQMLDDIKILIEVSEEKAKQSVLSEIKQLESQFNPHFLFNTLEMIRYMVKMKSEDVDKVIVSLSNLLRYSINNSITTVTIQEDIEYTKNYLLIQKYRFGDDFQYVIDVEEEAYDCIVPKLIIQPMIENSIKYGFENRHSLTIRITVRYTEDGLVIVIYDNGAGMKPEVLEQIKVILQKSKNDSAHIGLFNVHRKIQLMYGEKYGIVLMSETNGGTVVKIILPNNRSEENAEGSNR